MDKDNLNITPKLYKKRYLMLLLFCLYAIGNTVQFMQYSVIADVAVSYYNVSYNTVDWSSMIFSISYVVFCFPGGYLIDKIGLRSTMLIGVIGTALGAWIKVLSVDNDRFWVALLGQAVTSIFQITILPIIPKVSAVWFGANEVSTATSLGLIGAQLGTAMGYILPPLLVTQGSRENIEKGLYINTLTVAIYSSIMIPIIILFYANKPAIPPSMAQLKIQEVKTDFKKSIKNLLRNPSFILYLFIFIINMGAYTPYAILLNQILLHYYPGAATDVGVMGLIVTSVSFVGTFLSCYLLDKFKKYRITTLVTHLLYLLSIVLFVATLDLGITVVCITLSLSGLCMGAALSLGIELIVEVTYPEPENITVGILISLSQVSSVTFVFLYSHIFKNIDVIWANVSICLIIFIADLLFFFMKFDLKRQKAQKIGI